MLGIYRLLIFFVIVAHLRFCRFHHLFFKHSTSRLSSKLHKFSMTSALSSAYVLLGKATISDPPDWSTAVGAIHTLSSLLKCSECKMNIVDSVEVFSKPLDSFSLLCDTCHRTPAKKMKVDDDANSSKILSLLIENIRNLSVYSLRAFQHVPVIDAGSSDEEENEYDIVVVPPTHTTQAKFVSKLRKFAKNFFGIVHQGWWKMNTKIISFEKVNHNFNLFFYVLHCLGMFIVLVLKNLNKASILAEPKIKEENEMEITSLTPQSPAPKAVIVTSPNNKSGQWQINKSPVKRHSHVVINGNKIGRDQIVKTTLRPSMTCPFTASNGTKPPNSPNLNDFVVQLEEGSVLKSNKSCRCGNATSTPGKLTCGGQRCPCYVQSKSCLDCKCKGCRNPHQANGIKVIRPHLQVKSLGASNGGSNKYYTITSTPLVSSQNHPNSLTSIRRIHLN